MEDNLWIARVIKRQLYHFGAITLSSWGAHEFKGGDRFLEFKVQGFKLKGYVRITLNGLDLYDITFKDQEGKQVHEIKNVYMDCLVEQIDGVVETTNGDYTPEQKQIIKKQNPFLE